MTAPISVVSAKKYCGVERRRSLRKPTFVNSCIVYGAEIQIVACTIRDLSEGGARISVSSPELVPDHLTLLEPIRLIAYEANVRWRYGALLGLAFERETSIASDEIDRLYLLRQEALKLIDPSDREMRAQGWSEAATEAEHGRSAVPASVKPFLIIVTDRDTDEFTIEGPMIDDKPWIDAVRAAHDAGRQVSCHAPGPGTREEVAQWEGKHLKLKLAPSGSIVRPEAN